MSFAAHDEMESPVPRRRTRNSTSSNGRGFLPMRSSRATDFLRITESLASAAASNGQDAIVAEGDSLSLLQKMPDQSVSLIVTDPPYHTTKKHNIYGDTAFDQDADYVHWIAKYVIEWRRVLRPNGSLFFFCASEMAARLEVQFANNFNVLSHIVWTKPNDPGFDGWKQKMKKQALRQWYAHSERILFVEPATDGNLHRSPFANFLREMRKQARIAQHELTEIIGAYGKVNHGGAVSNWETGRNIPSRDQYAKICAALLATGNISAMPPYEDAIRPFQIDASKEFTDVWTFPSVRPYKGKHPAEKPAALLEHVIDATSYPGDIVLDCFAGSGSTAMAALKLGRRSVSMEIEPRWVSRIVARLGLAEKQERHAQCQPHASPHPSGKRDDWPQLPLWAEAK